jgi:acyl-coenzyme A thioesterase PaaI-like protein
VTGDKAPAEWFTSIPFTAAIGLTAPEIGAQVSCCRLPDHPGFLAGDGPARLCEGLITAAIDQAGSLAVWSAMGLAVPHATICLGVSFLAPARPAALLFEVRMLAVGETLAQTEVRVLQDGQAIARACVDYAIGRFPGAGRPGAAVLPVADSGHHAMPAAADFGAALGLQAQADDATALPFADWLIGSRDPVALHGGVLAAAAIATARRAAGPGLQLFDISVDYLRAGLPQATAFRPNAVSRTRSTALVEVDGVQDGGSRHVGRTRARFITRS